MIYLVTSRDHDVLRPDVTYVNEWSNGPAVSVRFGATGIYLDPATARQLAADILAALPEDVCGMPGCTIDHGGAV